MPKTGDRASKQSGKSKEVVRDQDGIAQGTTEENGNQGEGQGAHAYGKQQPLPSQGGKVEGDEPPRKLQGGGGQTQSGPPKR